MARQNLLAATWAASTSGVTCTKEGAHLRVKNTSAKPQFVNGPAAKFGIQYCLEFAGEVVAGSSALACQARNNPEKKSEVVSLAEATINSTGIFTKLDDYLNNDNFFAIKLMPESEVLITKFDVWETPTSSYEDDFVKQHLSENETLVLTPDYPTQDNKYLCAFVHSRLIAYKRAGLNVDVVCFKPYRPVFAYNYEGIDVLRLSYFDVRTLLRLKHYKKIIIHFFTEKVARALESCDLSGTEIYIWSHSSDLLYWDTPDLSAQYFKEKKPISDKQRKLFEKRDAIVHRWNNNKHVHWVFVSEFAKHRAEETIGLTFNNASVIPNFVDKQNFNYVEKDVELRKKVFFVRKYDALSSYSVDVAVRCILELSRRPFFNDLEFNIYGMGPYHAKLFAPVSEFNNVHLYKRYLSREEISEAHKQNGIALFPTRYDTQGVSMCEAASSGLAVVSTKRDSVFEFLPEGANVYADAEDFVGFADVIERLYNEPEAFAKAARMAHAMVSEKCGYANTIQRELDLIAAPVLPDEEKRCAREAMPVLSIAIPSYNMAAYLPGCICSLMNQPHASWLDVVIVNDGSKDNTVAVAKELMARYNREDAPVIRLIDKENGGHGSAVNAGLAAAEGKYFRVIDADDWVDSGQFEKLLEILKAEETDIVLCDYTEDLSIPSDGKDHKLYTNMVPEVHYNFDDLCYENYGFAKWGPIMHTGSFKTKMLQGNGFKLSEHCFYVDMQFDMYSIEDAKSIVYYPLNVYQYFVGREGQSVSKASFVKNRFNHQHVIISMLDHVRKAKGLSKQKKNYIVNKLIYPLLGTQYLILTRWHPDRKEFLEFDKKLSAYPEVYKICKRWGLSQDDRYQFVFHRRTKGMFLGNEKLAMQGVNFFKNTLKPRRKPNS